MATVAIGVGVSIASAILVNALTPRPKINSGLEDLAILKSELGVSIPKCFGMNRISGNVVWGLDIIKLPNHSGKGGGNRTEDKYTGTFALLLCEGQISDIRKIWMNNKLVSTWATNAGGVVDGSAKESQKFLEDHVEIYYGTPSQNPSPTIQAIEGSDIPAFRNLVYLVFKDLPLEDYGNAIPAVEVEIIASTVKPKLSEIISYVLTLGGYSPSDFDVTDLATTEVTGAVFKQDNQSIRDFIEDLARIYFFIPISSGGKLIFKLLKSTAAPYVIPPDDLGVIEEGSEQIALYTESQSQVIDLPSQVQVEYPNVNNTYNRGLQTAYKSTATHENQVNLQTSVVLGDSDALTVAVKTLEFYWSQRKSYKNINLSLDYLFLKPGDLVTTVIRNVPTTMQIQSIDIGANSILTLSCLAYDTGVNNLVAIAPTETSYDPRVSVPYYGEPEPLITELPALSFDDATYGIYGSAYAEQDTSNWQGGSIYGAEDGTNFAVVANLPQLVAFGKTDTVLYPTSEFVVDRASELTVTLEYGELDNLTDLDFYALKQIALVNGELIAFQNAQLIAPKQYILSNLIRGCKGTQSSITLHGLQSNFVLAKGEYGLVDIAQGTLRAGTQFTFKVAPSRVNVTSVVPEVDYTPSGLRLRHYKPTIPKLKRLQDLSLRISWEYCTRLDGDWYEFNEAIPIDYSELRFNLKIKNGAVVMREVEVTQNYYLYSSSDQITDFGNNISTLDLELYQVSSEVGIKSTRSVTGLVISEFDI